MATQYRHVSANMLKDLSQGQVAEDLNEISRYADVIGCQEVNSNGHRNAVNNMKNRGWGVFWPGGTPHGKPDGANQIPILWRTNIFTLLTTGTAVMGPGQSGVTPSRHISYVVLKAKKTGEIVVRLNTHFIHQAWTSHHERQAAWNAHEKKMLPIMRNLANQYGSCIGGGDINRDHYDFPNAYNYYPAGSTYEGRNYDLLFVVGRYLDHGTMNTITTHSDHKAVVMKLESIAPKHAPVIKKPPKSEPKQIIEKPPLPPLPRTVITPRSRWRYVAERLNGNGTGTLVHSDVPLRDPEITQNLSGYDSLNATITPEMAFLKGTDGRPVFDEWGTAIYADNEGDIRAGCIISRSSFTGPEWRIESNGFAGYSDGMPWVSTSPENYLGVEVDPLDVLRVIWNHIQSKPKGNIGLEIDPLKTGLKIGKKLEQAEYDTQSGSGTFESGPVQINWYTNHNLAEDINTLASSTPFDWRERHWWEGSTIRHRLELGYPKLGLRRNELRFTVGENVDPVAVERAGTDYASDALVLGSGEGRAMIRGTSHRTENDRLRRVAVVTDSSLNTAAKALSRARAEVAWRNDIDNFTEITVLNDERAPLGSLQVGDEIYLGGKVNWNIYDTWVRVTSIRFSPNTAGTYTLSVMKTNRIDS